MVYYKWTQLNIFSSKTPKGDLCFIFDEKLSPKRGRPFVLQKALSNKPEKMEFFSSTTADLHLLVMLFGLIIFIAISDFLEYLKNKKKK
jgi:hypothetical protein